MPYIPSTIEHAFSQIPIHPLVCLDASCWLYHFHKASYKYIDHCPPFAIHTQSYTCTDNADKTFCPENKWCKGLVCQLCLSNAVFLQSSLLLQDSSQIGWLSNISWHTKLVFVPRCRLHSPQLGPWFLLDWSIWKIYCCSLQTHWLEAGYR